MISAGSGVGVEFCEHVLRAVLLLEGSAEPAATAEVSLRSVDDDRAVYDSLIRLRAELGGPELPTRIATFPSGSHMRRIDVTDKTGPELNALRADIDRRHHTASTMLVDDGPRRWMHVVHWPIGRIRRLEELAERAGFVDVAVEPSPAALVRCLATSTTYIERSAAAGEAFVATLEAGVPVAAVTMSAVGRSHPELVGGVRPFSVRLFDGVVDAAALAEQIEAVGHSQSGRPTDADDVGIGLIIDGSSYPPFPPHDLRAPERQCVAIGAAIGAAGLAGRLRPVDIITDDTHAVPLERRPWVVERVAAVSPRPSASRPGVARRTLARLLSRRQ